MAPIDEAHRDFGIELQKLRERRQLSTSELAFLSGVAHSYLHELEAGAKSPTLRTLRRLASALWVEPHKLVRAAELLAKHRAERRFFG